MSASEVADHYNKVRQTNLDDRKDSRIFYMRNMNNWIKSQLINEAVALITESGVDRPRVLDIACGKGGDLRKWSIAKVRNVVMVDIADVSIDQAKNRYQEMQSKFRHHNSFDAQFITADCTKENLADLIEDKDLFDLTSCQFAMHYSFVDEDSAKTFLKNATASLKPGGIFIGTLPDADRIVWAVRQGEEKGKFANDVCKISYENVEELENGTPPLFGAKFHFSLDSQVNCPEFLAYFPLVQHMLEKLDMELLFVRNFAEAVEKWMPNGKHLLGNMQGLEMYPGTNDRKLSGVKDGRTEADEYEDAKAKFESLGSDDPKNLGTISKSEWEAICMYLVFGFRKKQVEKKEDIQVEAEEKDNEPEPKIGRFEDEQNR